MRLGALGKNTVSETTRGDSGKSLTRGKKGLPSLARVPSLSRISRSSRSLSSPAPSGDRQQSVIPGWGANRGNDAICERGSCIVTARVACCSSASTAMGSAGLN